MSRVDPVTIATYPGGAHAGGEGLSMEARVNATNGCGLARGPYDYHIGAINLDCFRFPEDWGNRSTTNEQIAQHTSERADIEMRNADAARTRFRDATSARRSATAATLSPATPSVDPPSLPSLRPWLAYSRAATNRVDRNRLTEILLKHSDDICTTEMGRITANQATVNASLNILATGATTVANIVTGDQAQSILTGIGTFAGASRSHINADVYRNVFAHAISRAITTERDKQRDAIVARYNEEPETFTIDAAIRAVNRYHGQCSFYRGLDLLLSAVENNTTLERSLRERERQVQIGQIEEEIARLRSDIRNPAARGTNVTSLQERLNALVLQRSSLVTSPISVSRPETPNPQPQQPQ